MIRSYLNQLMRWRSGMFLTFDNRDVTGEGGSETRLGVDVFKFILFLFGKNRFVQGKITCIFVPILERDFVSSQSAFIQGIKHI